MTAQRKEECGAEQIKLLKKKGKISVDMELLQDIKKYYHAGNNIVHIFEPPKIGEDILLLEHFVSSRDNINTHYKNEVGFDREWVIYHVERVIVHSDNYWDPNNQVVLSYHVFKSPKRERRMRFANFYSGFYYPKALTDEEKETVNKYRSLVDESFNIRRIQ